MFEDFFSHLTWLEAIGTLFGVMQVLWARKNNVNNYLFGIVGILISIYVRYHAKLYADILLDGYYFIMSIYGYFYWKFGKNHHASPISASSQSEFITAMSIVLGCFGLMAYWLNAHTNSDVPYWDAVVAAFAWAGMWLMAKRKVENWIFLNLSNLVAIPLLIYKGLFLYAGLTVFLFIIAISGYLKWKKIIKNDRSPHYSTT